MSIIMHIDLDAFFAAVEERENVELRGKPVIIGADPHSRRGVVSTANYRAREYGIHSGMPISRAHRLCPDGVYLPVNFALYWQASERVMAIIRRHAEKFQQASIDEAYLDVSSAGSFDEAEQRARALKYEIFDNEKISCSVGIAPNKLVAKIASDHNKPDGLTVVREHDMQNFLFPLPVRTLYGVGKKTEEVLQGIGIRTIGDLARYDVQSLMRALGRWGMYLHYLANGVDESQVEEIEGIQSLGREVTFEEDTSDVISLAETLDAIAADLAQALRYEGVSFRTVAIKVRFENFETHTRQRTLLRSAADVEAIKAAARDLFEKFYQSKKKIRLIGIRVSNLSYEGRQKSLREY